MQIRATDTILGQFAANQFNKGQTKIQNPFSPGGRLCIGGKVAVPLEDRVAFGKDNKTLQLMDKSISKIGGLLEQMKNITKLSQDDSLSDLDRIDMQIEMDHLQKTINKEVARMSFLREDKTELEINALLLDYQNPEHENEMLKRARERILNSEEWDAAETFALITKPLGVIAAADGVTQSLPQNIQGEFMLPEGVKREEAVLLNGNDWGYGGHYVVTNDPSVPTVSDILKESGNYYVMDSKSAQKSMEQIDKKLEELAKQRKGLIELIVKNEGDFPVDALISKLEGFFGSLVKGMAEAAAIGSPKDESGRNIARHPNIVEEETQAPENVSFSMEFLYA
jgi:hypothetical protein